VLWKQLVTGEYSHLLKLTQPDCATTSTTVQGAKTFPTELSSKLTHQITQITVFYQLNQHKAGFRIPTKKVSLVAKLAKQIVVQDKINVPRQTRSQFTLTVLDMLQ